MDNLLATNKLDLLITICARGGSKGVKGKNIRPLMGKPLIYYTIKQALEWGKAKRVIVSTDSLEIAEIAKKYGAEVPFIRPSELASDTAAKVPVIRHAFISCENIFQEKYDFVMDLDVTSPVRTLEDLDNALNLFLDKKPKSLLSVVPAHRNPYFNILEEKLDGKVDYSKRDENITCRQDAPMAYDVNSSIYIYDRNYILSGSDKAVSDNTIVYIMSDLARTDIDNELDFKFLEFLLKESVINL